MTKSLLLLALNARYSHSNPTLFQLKNILEREGFSCALEELTIKENLTTLLDAVLLRKERPTHLLMSVYIWNSQLTEAFLRDLQLMAPEIQLVLGGPEVGYNREYWGEICPEAYLIHGPGEEVILPLMRGEFKEKWITAPPVKMENVPFPYTSGDLELLENRLVYYETSRGCPFKCSYCLSSCEDQPLASHDLNRALKELKILAFSGARTIKLVDRSFNCPPSRARKIWTALLEWNGPVPFHFEVHPLFLEEEDFQLLAKVPAHLFHFEIGIQTVREEELELINRKGSWSVIQQNISRLIRETSIPIHLDQIVGLPGSDRDSVIHSFNSILSLRPEEFQMGFLKILAGTPLAAREGKDMIASAQPPYQVLETPWLSYKEIRYFQRIEQWLNGYYNSELFTRTMELVLGHFPPYQREPFLLFEKLENFSSHQGRVKSLQWARLGELLWDCLSEDFPEQKKALKDGLRRDWAPLSQGQYLPGFLQFEDPRLIKDLRREFWPLCEQEGIALSDYKRALLIVLEESGEVEISVPVNKERRILRFDQLLPKNSISSLS
ncbi:MAG: DUF4080 domain-containing protein [Spirochaetales bacterium]|nr:DUF4080 domain-containing protein [Spirochaetales bacterium]